MAAARDENQGRAARGKTLEQMDDFAGRVKAKRVEFDPARCPLAGTQRLNPQLRRIRAEMGSELTSAEIAMDGSISMTCFAPAALRH